MHSTCIAQNLNLVFSCRRSSRQQKQSTSRKKYVDPKHIESTVHYEFFYCPCSPFSFWPALPRSSSAPPANLIVHHKHGKSQHEVCFHWMQKIQCHHCHGSEPITGRFIFNKTAFSHYGSSNQCLLLTGCQLSFGCRLFMLLQLLTWHWWPPSPSWKTTQMVEST